MSYELKREIIKLCDELTGLSARKMSPIVSQKVGRPITYTTIKNILKKRRFMPRGSLWDFWDKKMLEFGFETSPLYHIGVRE